MDAWADHWLGLEPDPRELLITYPSEPLAMWPISTRVNAPENDDASLLERVNDISLGESPAD
jgi:putative SOS response-associated peptidase YedK